MSVLGACWQQAEMGKKACTKKNDSWKRNHGKESVQEESDNWQEAQHAHARRRRQLEGSSERMQRRKT
jgi:hypothetical protein